MSARRPLLLVTLLAGCFPNLYKLESWTHATVTDAEKRAADKYECMKENTSFRYRKGEDARESAGQEVDPALFRACMEARGYTLVRQRPRMDASRGPLSRAPDQGPVVLSAELGVGGFGVELVEVADYSEVRDGSATAPDSIRRVVATGYGGGPSAGFGVTVPLGPLGEIGARAGARFGAVQGQMICDADSGFVSCPEPDRAARFTAPIVTVGALGRAPFLPRLFGHVDLGLTTLGPIAGYEGEVEYQTSDGEDVSASLSLGDAPIQIMPFGQLGVGADPIYAEPWGLRVGCAVHYGFRGRLLDGPREVEYPGGSIGGGDGPSIGVGCGLGVRWSPGGGD